MMMLGYQPKLSTTLTRKGLEILENNHNFNKKDGDTEVSFGDSL